MKVIYNGHAVSKDRIYTVQKDGTTYTVAALWYDDVTDEGNWEAALIDESGKLFLGTWFEKVSVEDAGVEMNTQFGCDEAPDKVSDYPYDKDDVKIESKTLKLYESMGVLAHEKTPVYSVHAPASEVYTTIEVDVSDLDLGINDADDYVITLDGLDYMLQDVLACYKDGPSIVVPGPSRYAKHIPLQIVRVIA